MSIVHYLATEILPALLGGILGGLAIGAMILLRTR